MVAAPIAERHRVPLEAIIGSYNDGTDSKRDHMKSIAFIIITLVRST